jgi:hypothetical protein
MDRRVFAIPDRAEAGNAMKGVIIDFVAPDLHLQSSKGEVKEKYSLVLQWELGEPEFPCPAAFRPGIPVPQSCKSNFRSTML